MQSDRQSIIGKDDSPSHPESCETPQRSSNQCSDSAASLSSEKPKQLTFDERIELVIQLEDGTRMIPSVDSPYLPNGELNYVPMPRTEARSGPFPCQFTPPDGLTHESAFVPVGTIWPGHFDHYQQFVRFLNQHPEIRTWKPSKQRLWVHAGDWHRYLAELAEKEQKFDQLDNLEGKDVKGLQDYLQDSAGRMLEIRSRKAKR